MQKYLLRIEILVIDLLLIKISKMGYAYSLEKTIQNPVTSSKYMRQNLKITYNYHLFICLIVIVGPVVVTLKLNLYVYFVINLSDWFAIPVAPSLMKKYILIVEILNF